MESGRSLAKVISEMQNEIRKLESENQALRGQLSRPTSALDSVKPSALSAQQKDGLQESSTHANLRRNVSAPELEGQFKENIIMTVRRYSISSNSMNGSRKNEILHKPRRYEETLNNNKWTKLHDGSLGRPSVAYTKPDIEKLTNRHSLQEYVNKNRAKVKTVTFLLPVDDIYTNRPALAEHLPERSTCELKTITETDS
ncbi:putative coiled-coil domain-containing protein 195 [Pseudorasbora parva]|uniref:putative coiled-coil domain-containing protein 195 n=1 Tax=Pseudorasbora parva TaxID=51549 RepID=UPI00351F3531